MTRIINRGKETVAYRDDTGKHYLQPGKSAVVVGDHHLPLILSYPGIELVKK